MIRTSALMHKLARALVLSPLLSIALCAFAGPRQQDAKSPQEAPFIFRSTTREVVVDVIAVDSHNHPVVNLAAGDLEVWEQVGRSNKIAKSISSLHIFDPDSASAAPATANTGFHIARNMSCLERSTIHYELAYHPGAEGWTPGYHQVLITTHRRGVKLFFRHQYYVGQTSIPDKSPGKDPQKSAKELWMAACDHPLAPLSISLRATLISLGRTDLLRYA